MAGRFINVAIEGDYVDSFIYSGTLFLVNADSIVTTYAWEELVDASLAKRFKPLQALGISWFLKDGRRNFSEVDWDCALIITSQELSAFARGHLTLRGWPTDINIFSNNFYVASEFGVDRYKFDYQTKSIVVDEKLSIWDEYAYHVSPNSGQRLAIAAGNSGVITAYPRGQYINAGDLLQTIEEPSIDCEWVDENLVSNTFTNSYLSVFSSLPSKENYSDAASFFSSYNAAKRSANPAIPFSEFIDTTVKYAWVAGTRLFSLLSDEHLRLRIDELEIESSEGSPAFETGELEISSESGTEKIYKARSGSFGAVIEMKNSLLLIDQESTRTLSSSAVSWRVFPRARNFLNQLHVVENNLLNIFAFEVSFPTSNNYFAIADDETPES